MAFQLYSDLVLYNDGKSYYIVNKVAIEKEVNCSSLEINQLTEEISLNENLRIESLKGYISYDIFGVIGFIKLSLGMYIITIEERVLIGNFMGNDIYKLSKIQFHLCKAASKRVTKEMEEKDQYFLDMIRNQYSTDGLYFSYTTDLTRSLQVKNGKTIEKNYSSLSSFLLKFVWNEYFLHLVLHMKKAMNYFTPIIHGYFGFIKIEWPGLNPFTLNLISRRSNRNAGIRYFVRGSDSYGNVANYVETELIFIDKNSMLSFIQLRGSIPLLWSQYPNLKYKPKVFIDTNKDHAAIVKTHFEEELTTWKKTVIINLVDKKGDELTLSNMFHQYIDMIPNSINTLRYIHFDFHKECKNMNLSRLANLIESIDDDCKKMGVFFARISEDPNSALQIQVQSNQNGVFRTNCIDCLDRTNVVQSMLGWHALLPILVEIGIIPSADSTNNDLMKISYLYKNMWADNADMLSIQYSGTPALKTDCTRLGKRTYMGLLSDGINSAKRYFYNNFYDGYKQDCIDLVTGNCDLISSIANIGLNSNTSVISSSLPVVFISLIALLFGDIFLIEGKYFSRICMAVMLISGLAGIYQYIMSNPQQYVNWTRLTSLSSRAIKDKNITHSKKTI